MPNPRGMSLSWRDKGNQGVSRHYQKGVWKSRGDPAATEVYKSCHFCFDGDFDNDFTPSVQRAGDPRRPRMVQALHGDNMNLIAFNWSGIRSAEMHGMPTLQIAVTGGFVGRGVVSRHERWQKDVVSCIRRSPETPSHILQSFRCKDGSFWKPLPAPTRGWVTTICNGLAACGLLWNILAAKVLEELCGKKKEINPFTLIGEVLGNIMIRKVVPGTKIWCCHVKRSVPVQHCSGPAHWKAEIQSELQMHWWRLGSRWRPCSIFLNFQTQTCYIESPQIHRIFLT